MSDTSKRELIEEAADEIWRRVTRVGTAGNETYEFCKGTAEAVLAVFEQATTPTDDERHWSDAAASAYPGDEYENYDLRTAFGRGVKWERSRTVQGEPTDAAVIEAVHAIGLRGFHVTASAMRAALRAAGEVKQ